MAGRKTWRYSVPMLLSADKGYWDTYLQMVQRMGADRVLLVGPGEDGGDVPPVEHYRVVAERLRERKAFFEPHGIEVAFWMWRTIGHAGMFRQGQEAFAFQQIVGPTGQEAGACFCPLDVGFVEYLRQGFGAVAESQVDLILLDDDYRLHVHGPEARVGCFCPLHVAAVNERLGSDLSAAQLAHAVLCGRGSEVRRAWLAVNGQALMDLAGVIEQAVHSVSPTTRVGLAMVGTLWESEGVDVVELVRRLAGPTQPLLRLSGAPYWTHDARDLAWITDYVRMQWHWQGDKEVELLAEADTFPHTRFHCSAAMLDAYERWLLAAGFPGFLHYAMVYAPKPTHETAYVAMTERSHEAREAAGAFFPAAYVARGVAIADRPYGFSDRVMPDDVSGAVSAFWRRPSAPLRWLPRLGVPMAFDDESGPVVMTGGSVGAMSDADVEALLPRGVLLDAPAAACLMARGVDVGVEAVASVAPPVFERFIDPELTGEYADERVRLYLFADGVFERLTPSSSARLVSEFVGSQRERLYPATIVYENARRQRFCVLGYDLERAFAADAGSQLLFDYAKQELIARCLAWVNRRPLPVGVVGHPDVHVMCREAPDGSRIALAVQNLQLDAVHTPTLRLPGDVTIGDQLEVLLPDAASATMVTPVECRREGDYAYVTLGIELPPMGLVGVAVSPGL